MNPNDFRPTPRAKAALFAFAVFLIAAFFGGCSRDSTAPKRVPLTVQAQGVGGATQSYSAAAALSGTLVAQDTIPVTFTRALLVVRDVRFVFADDDVADTLGLGDNDSTDADDDDGGQVRFFGPYVIDLLAGTAQNLGTQMVPPGEYHMIMGHLQSLGAGPPLASQYPELVGNTVLLEGDIAGEGGGHFIYVARIDTEFIIHGSFRLEEDTPATSFVLFDLSRLLLSREGHFLDPRITDNDLLIRQAIRHAVKVGIDENHDGEPDDRMTSETQ